MTISQWLVEGFWTLILLRNQISNWNHVTRRTGPQPAEHISRCSVFLFRFVSLLCLFIYLSIYPYLFSTLRNHCRPSGCARAQVYLYTRTQRCDATLATPPKRWRLLQSHEKPTPPTPHPHCLTSGFSRANKRPWGFGPSWYLLVRAEVKYVPFVLFVRERYRKERKRHFLFPVLRGSP